MDENDPMPHWWDEFHSPRREPVVKERKPRWPIIIGSMLLIGLAVVLAYPPPLPGLGN